MDPNPPRQMFIQGTTLEGRTFRPSDWAERLADVISLVTELVEPEQPGALLEEAVEISMGTWRWSGISTVW